PGGSSPDEQAKEILRLLNNARQAANLTPLTLDPKLTAAAMKHSQDEASTDTLSSDGSDGSNVGARVNREQYKWSSIAENLQASPEVHASKVFDQWWNNNAYRDSR